MSCSQGNRSISHYETIDLRKRVFRGLDRIVVRSRILGIGVESHQQFVRSGTEPEVL